MKKRALRYVVCVKQVPASHAVRLDPHTHTLIRQEAAAIVNPFDTYALELALRLRDEHGGTITVLSMGPPRAEEALEHCLRMGADDAVLLCDPRMAGSDTLATSRVLSGAISKIGYDLVVCGKQAIDGDTAQVGPGLAEFLGIPIVSCVRHIAFVDRGMEITRESDYGLDVYLCRLPLVVTVVRHGGLFPRPADGPLPEHPMRRWMLEDIDLAEADAGLLGSATRVSKTEAGSIGGLNQANYPVDAALAERLEFVLSGGVTAKAGRTLVRDSSDVAARRVRELLESEGLL